ncbi:MAG: aspartate-semialdehyde dehydrogenase [Bacteroidales bacterium]
MVIALVGATGLVGKTMMRVIEEQQLPFTDFIPCASVRSAGKEVKLNNKTYRVRRMEEALEARPELVIFSAGSAISKEFAPAFAEAGAFVIDNSSAWRGEPDVPLVVPEINANTISPDTKIISNPNCSTIQMVLALAPIHQKYGIRRVVIATYQSVTGTGIAAIQQLYNERDGQQGPMAYPHPIDMNCLPAGGDFDEQGYSAEEMKLVNETRKILNAPEMYITATAVRVPVTGGHSEAVNLELENDFDLSEIKKMLEETDGVVVEDDPGNHVYPMPKYAEGKDEVFVGRIRRDFSLDYGVNLWIVTDNLRKGAATNAIQIARYLIDNQYL